MLDTLLKFGSHRVDYFDQSGLNPQAFAFYVRGGMDAHHGYSADAKHQLYRGLALIASRLGFGNLAAVYIDVNDLENLERPAYVQLKRDLQAFMFNRVFILEDSALLGTPEADRDFAEISSRILGFELLCCDGQGRIAVPESLQAAMLMSVHG
jgi:hypothetical protein